MNMQGDVWITYLKGAQQGTGNMSCKVLKFHSGQEALGRKDLVIRRIPVPNSVFPTKSLG